MKIKQTEEIRREDVFIDGRSEAVEFYREEVLLQSDIDAENDVYPQD